MVKKINNKIHSAPLEPSTPLLPPDQDPFYQPPLGFEKEKEGTILKIRSSPHSLAAFSRLPQNVKQVHQILYRTTDALDQPIVTVTTLIEPHNADPSKLVSYQLAEDRPSILCSPSYILQNDDASNNSPWVMQAELLLIDTLLFHGWFVNVPDYEGPKSMFSVGKMNGQAILDAIRAVLASSPTTNLFPSAKVQLWGYSGGAFVTGWAVQLKDTYAPDLNIVGAAMGGTPVNLHDTLNKVNGTPYSMYIFSSILGLSAQYEEFATYVNKVMKPEKRKQLSIMQEQCLSDAFSNERLEAYLMEPNISFTDDPLPKKYIDASSLGQYKAPTIPLHLYHAANDDIVSFQQVKQLYTQWCTEEEGNGGGSSIELVKDQFSQHLMLGITGAESAIRFMMDRFDGQPLQYKCKERTAITSLLDSGAPIAFGTDLLSAFSALLGLPIGPL
ncbi:unnamed protein product [Cunninghamella echinulata]